MPERNVNILIAEHQANVDTTIASKFFSNEAVSNSDWCNRRCLFQSD